MTTYLIGVQGKFTDGETFGPFSKNDIKAEDIGSEIQALIGAMQRAAALESAQISDAGIIISLNESADAQT